jgi:hypothetical protein
MHVPQLIWFLAPTVALCDQQFRLIKSQIPSMLPKIVTGADKVDSWSRSTWEGVLVNVKLVVTTYRQYHFSPATDPPSFML